MNLPSASTSHQDTFAKDHLPPADLIAEVIFSGTPELAAYPNHMNVATVLLDEMVDGGFADNDAVHLGDTTWTYSELLARANQIAHFLVEDCGLVTGNRVLIRSPNSPMMVACWFGILKAGGICVSTMPLLRARELSGKPVAGSNPGNHPEVQSNATLYGTYRLPGALGFGTGL
jgi:2-aminobenzoate-CoA ligase